MRRSTLFPGKFSGDGERNGLVPGFSLEEDAGEQVSNCARFVDQKLRAFSSLAKDTGTVRPENGVIIENQRIGWLPIMNSIIRNKVDAPAGVSADAADIVFADHVIGAIRFDRRTAPDKPVFHFEATLFGSRAGLDQIPEVILTESNGE